MIKVWITEDIGTLTGIVSMTNGSTAVTGSGCAFTTELKVGDILRLADETTYWGQVKSIENDNALTLESNYQGETGSGDADAKEQYPFEFSFATISIPQFTENRKIVQTRTGTEVILSDPEKLHPARLTLNIHKVEIDVKSSIQKDSNDVYFANYLYWAHTRQQELVIFAKTSQTYPLPAYKVRCLEYDPELAGPATENELKPACVPSIEDGPDIFSFLFFVIADGSFTDWDDKSTAGYNLRN